MPVIWQGISIFRLLILLQRKKKYKSRTILGYKTLAEGVIRMDAVLQKSMDMTVELGDASIKNGRPGIPIATIRAIQITSSPVDQIDNKNNNSVLIAGMTWINYARWLLIENDGRNRQVVCLYFYFQVDFCF